MTKKKKINIAVLMGGKSSEHEISLISGAEVVKNLDPKKYNVFPIEIAKDGITWQLKSKDKYFLNTKSKKSIKKTKAVEIKQHRNLLKDNSVNVVFIAMHGPNGEDGTIQGLLELIGIPYTGSGVLASALGMDKIYSRNLFIQAGLAVPETVILTGSDPVNNVWKTLRPPIFVKPSNQGSSVGTSKVNSKKGLPKALKLAFSYNDRVLVEEFIDGTEITCGILGNEKPIVLPIVEIVTKNEFFDYEAKYSETLTEEIVPARINKKLTRKAQDSALIAYESLNCRGFGRVDMITKDNNIYTLEVNTIPGLTPMSLFPKAAKAAGITYSNLLDRVIASALNP